MRIRTGTSTIATMGRLCALALAAAVPVSMSATPTPLAPSRASTAAAPATAGEAASPCRVAAWPAASCAGAAESGRRVRVIAIHAAPHPR